MEKLEYLITELLKENEQLKDVEIPESVEDKKLLFRALCNIRDPKPISKEWLNIQDEFLSDELKNKGIVDSESLPFIKNKICLWQGDITLLKVDAIVNACNEYLLGCFYPNHHCIDNQIHFFSGVELRQKCNEIMNGDTLPTGKVRITPAYNLPSKYVIHTVGPIIYNEVLETDMELLKKCYINSLDIAKENKIRTIAFPCISTGEYHFPHNLASTIAIETVNNYLKENHQYFDKVIFNVFKDEDYNIYKKNLAK